MLVYCITPEKYFLVVNAANVDKDFAWIAGHTAGFDVKVENQSDDYSQLALQGPLAVKILQPLTDVDLTRMKSFWWSAGKVAGKSCLVSRTGYTGEDGFEVYTTDPNPGAIWTSIIDRGTPLGLLPVGLGARDTLRLEAKLMLYGNDITDKTTVLEADLKWIVKLQKGEFLGKPIIEKQLAEGLKRKLVGFELVDRGIARPHYPAYVSGQRVSAVCSGTYSPLLKKSIGLVYLPIEATAVGTEFTVGIRDKSARANVVPTPFYRRAK
jgi:aminomethyltransferase